MCCYAFSLLLNCTDLASMEDIFEIIINIFTAETTNDQYLQSIEKFQALISQRPKIRADVEEVLSRVRFFSNEYNINPDEEEDEDEDEYEDDCGQSEDLRNNANKDSKLEKFRAR